MTDLELLEQIARHIGRPLNQCTSHEDIEVQYPSFFADKQGHVVALNLSTVGLTEVPSEIGLLSRLRYLRLFGNRLKSLPDETSKLTELRNLYLSNNEFDEVPRAVCRLTSLICLALNGNQLSFLPPELANLQQLRLIKLNHNRLRQVPEVLRGIPSLSGLFIGSNDVDAIPGWIADLKQLSELGLARTQIAEWHNEASSLRQLQYLDLSETPLEDASTLLAITTLEHLSLRGTKLRSLPEAIGMLARLKWLDISDTRLDNIPTSIENCRALQVLRMTNLKLGTLPDGLFALSGLRELNLSGTQVRSLPPTISKLRSLEKLDLSGMGLSSVPAKLFSLRRLTFLNLSSNRLRELPSQVVEPDLHWNRSADASAGHRTGLFLRPNPFEVPPPEVLSRGRDAVALYFRSSRSSTRAIDEVKVLLIGDGGSGKTSLANRLLSRQFDPNEKQTHGINIDDHYVSFANRRIKVHIWDFGGQEIMHATHQFFLSKRSAYILVLDSRREEKTEYWLKHVEAFGGDSPIIIVVNKIDENPSFDINRRFLTEKYKGIRSVIRVSCATGEGIAEVEKVLSGHLARLDHATTVWPSAWFAVKERVELLHEDYISFADFRKIAESVGVTDPNEQETLAEFLHDLGAALRFNDLPLRDTNVISPRWLTQGVYRIVNSEEVASTGGMLDLHTLATLLPPSSYPIEKHYFLIELMSKFELCYHLDARTVLMPALLPIEEPAIRAPEDPLVRFIIEYDFLPKSILPRLIVRMHRDIEAGLQWRSGVVLSNQIMATRAIIRQDEAEKRISITVSGEHRKDYLGVVAHTLREISASFERINAIEKVPMPDRQNVLITYQHLLRLDAKGVRTYMPDGTDREYDVQELLGYVKPQPKTEEEVLRLLHQLVERGDTEETLANKANKTVMLQPNFFGLGINLNELISRVIKREPNPS